MKNSIMMNTIRLLAIVLVVAIITALSSLVYKALTNNEKQKIEAMHDLDNINRNLDSLHSEIHKVNNVLNSIYIDYHKVY
jgi:peptidoglycan hydrolase CwlO-like protein